MNKTQKDFDIGKYLGQWYEIAKYKFPFEKDCFFAEAEYSWNEQDSTMNIKNVCLDANRKVKRVSLGKARIPDMRDKSKLKVKFFGTDAWPGEGDYYVHWTDYNNYSIVGGPDGRFLWLLSRKQAIPKEDVSLLLRKIQSYGYDTNKLLSNSKLVY